MCSLYQACVHIPRMAAMQIIRSAQAPAPSQRRSRLVCKAFWGPWAKKSKQNTPQTTAKALLQVVQSSRWGLNLGSNEVDQVNQLVSELNEQSKGPANNEQYLGVWTLQYTTEASVLSLAKSLPVTNVSQEIELEGSSGRVANRIEFSMGIALQAGAPAKSVKPGRVSYAFDTLRLELGSLHIPLPPPKAGGWTEAVYIDDDMRVMQNSRGDTLVFTRQAQAIA